VDAEVGLPVALQAEAQGSEPKQRRLLEDRGPDATAAIGDFFRPSDLD
jgi:hypothetical protein